MKIFRDALLSPSDDRLLWRSFLNFILSVSVTMALLAILLLGGKALGYFEVLPETREVEISVLDFVGMVIFAPVVETFLLSGLLAFLSMLNKSILVMATISACIWGVLHGLIAPVLFVGSAFPFFVFSCAYLTWRPRSYWHGFAAAALPHAMQNLLAFLMVWLAE